MVGLAGFEPTTPCPPGKCATRLRYSPSLSANGRADKQVVENLASPEFFRFPHFARTPSEPCGRGAVGFQGSGFGLVM